MHLYRSGTTSCAMILKEAPFILSFKEKLDLITLHDLYRVTHTPARAAVNYIRVYEPIDSTILWTDSRDLEIAALPKLPTNVSACNYFNFLAINSSNNCSARPVRQAYRTS